MLNVGHKSYEIIYSCNIDYYVNAIYVVEVFQWTSYGSIKQV